MPSSAAPPVTVYLVRHAKAADRTTWRGADRDRPLTARGVEQARRLAAHLPADQLAVVASSPWLRCAQTAGPIAEAAGLEVALEPRLGYDRPDLRGWLRGALGSMEDRAPSAIVAVSHGDLIPDLLADWGLLDGLSTFRTGSLFRLTPEGGRFTATYVDRADLRVGGA